MNVLPLYTLVMANSLAYMAKAKQILHKGMLGETLLSLFLSSVLLTQPFHTRLPSKVHLHSLSCFPHLTEP